MEREGGNVKQPNLYSVINHKLPYVQAKCSDSAGSWLTRLSPVMVGSYVGVQVVG